MERNQKGEYQKPIEIPMDSISSEALNELIKSFILREGTDYGATEISIDTKFKQIKSQLERKLIKIVFDPESESVTLVPSQSLR